MGSFIQVWTEVEAIFQVVHAAVVCILVIVRFVQQLLQMYRMTNQWQFNRYMNLLFEQGLLYFFAYVFIRPFYAASNARK